MGCELLYQLGNLQLFQYLGASATRCAGSKQEVTACRIARVAKSFLHVCIASAAVYPPVSPFALRSSGPTVGSRQNNVQQATTRWAPRKRGLQRKNMGRILSIRPTYE